MTAEKTDATPPGSRPRRRRKDARPGEIIDAAMESFVEQGYTATRLEDVAERAGIVKGTIYRYFDSKEALFEAVVHAKLTPIVKETRSMTDVFEGSSAELLTWFLKRVYQELVSTDRRGLMRLMIAEGYRFPKLVEIFERATLWAGREVVLAILRRGVESGEFRKCPVMEQPDVIMGPALLAGVWKMVFEQVRPMDTEAFRDAHIELMLKGLSADGDDRRRTGK